MNRKWALISHEMRTLWRFLALGLFCAMVFCLILSSFMENFYDFSGAIDYGWTPYSSYSYPFDIGTSAGSCFSAALVSLLCRGHWLTVPLFAVLTAIQFSEFHSRRRQEFMNSLPYTKSERFLVKAALGYGVITISCLAMSAGTLLVRQHYIGAIQRENMLSPYYKQLFANETIWHTIRSLALFWLTLLALYSIFLMMHSLVNRGILASLAGVGVVTAPLELCYVVLWFAEALSPDEKVMSIADSEKWLRLTGAFWGNAVSTNNPLETGTNYGIYMVAYDTMWIQFLAMAFILILCNILAWRVIRIQDLAKAGIIVPLRWARICLSVGSGICFGTALGVGLGYDAGGAGGVFCVCLVFSTLFIAGFLVLLRRSVR